MPVSYAAVRILETGQGALSDSLGRFELCNIKANKITIEVTHVSYYSIKSIARTDERKAVVIALDEKTNTAREVVIERGRSKQFTSGFAGNQTISRLEIMKLPVLLGESDVLKAVQLLPGVRSTGEGIGGVFVQGGSPGQNLFLLDNMELMNPSHLMGFYSVFNPLTTERVEIHKGITPAHLQGRLSSTIDVQSERATVENTGVSGNVGNISSSLALRQASKDNTFGITIGLRRSYLDAIGWMASPLIPDESNYFKNNHYGFYDINGKATLAVSPLSSLTLSWYLGRDVFNMNDRKYNYAAGTNWGNKSVALTYYKAIRDGYSRMHSINYSYAKSVFDGTILDNNIYFGSSITQVNQKNHWMKTINNHYVRAGVECNYTFVIPQDMNYLLMDHFVRRKNEYHNLGITTFIGDKISISDRAELYAAFRLISLGIFQPGAYVDDQAPISKLSGKVIKARFSWSSTVASSLFPQSDRSVKAAFSRNVQPLHLASVSSIPLPNDIWMTSSVKIRPEVSYQFSGGYYVRLPLFDASVEAYAKYLENQLIYNAVQDQSVPVDFEDMFLHGKGLAYGVDFSISKKTGAFTGSFTYSLSRSQRSFPAIMDGRWFNDKYDRTHDLKVNASYCLNKKWDFSALWIYATGNNLSLPSGRWWMMGAIMNDYDGYNSFRLPAYHRLDVSANLNLKVKRLKESVLNFSIINLYNRSNPYFAFYRIQMGENQYNIKIKANQVSLFPILPSISWRFKF